MAEALSRAQLLDVRLIGFDSFKGMPEEAAHQGWEPGAYASTVAATRAYLVSQGVQHERVDLVEGWFKDTLNDATVERLGIEKASLVMVDCDIYTASKEALWFVEPLIRDQAVVIFDDWGWRSEAGEIGQKEAFAEFLEAFPEFAAAPLPAYIDKARIFKLTRI
jgi:hypothetical protein